MYFVGDGDSFGLQILEQSGGLSGSPEAHSS
jgi:hypothetical protein